MFVPQHAFRGLAWTLGHVYASLYCYDKVQEVLPAVKAAGYDVSVAVVTAFNVIPIDITGVTTSDEIVKKFASVLNLPESATESLEAFEEAGKKLTAADYALAYTKVTGKEPTIPDAENFPSEAHTRIGYSVRFSGGAVFKKEHEKDYWKFSRHKQQIERIAADDWALEIKIDE
jgi:hypothetical protein